VLVARAPREPVSDRSQIKAAGVRIEKDLQADLWVIGSAVHARTGDPQSPAQCARALVDAPEPWSGSAFARRRHRFDRVRDTVRRPPQQLDRIFDPFFTTKPVGQGLWARSVDHLRHRPGTSTAKSCGEPARGWRRIDVELPSISRKRSARRRSASPDHGPICSSTMKRDGQAVSNAWLAASMLLVTTRRGALATLSTDFFRIWSTTSDDGMTA